MISMPKNNRFFASPLMSLINSAGAEVSAIFLSDDLVKIKIG
jgi:hypothetical protein